MSFANISAPRPTRRTWSVSSRTFLANLIGFLIICTEATAPADLSAPFIIEASISWTSSELYTEPLPALNKVESSNSDTANSTASMLDPPSSRILYAEINVSLTLFSISCCLSMLRPESTPAPPWPTIPKLSALIIKDIFNVYFGLKNISNNII